MFATWNMVILPGGERLGTPCHMVHWEGKRNSDGIPQAEATVLQRVTDESCMLRDVPVRRAVGTLTHEVETWMVRKFVGAAVREMRSWHVFVQIVWRSQV